MVDRGGVQFGQLLAPKCRHLLLVHTGDARDLFELHAHRQHRLEHQRFALFRVRSTHGRTAGKLPCVLRHA